MSIEVKAGNDCVFVTFWNVEEAPEAMRLLLERSEEQHGAGSHIRIEGRTRNDKGFLDPGFFIATKGIG